MKFNLNLSTIFCGNKYSNLEISFVLDCINCSYKMNNSLFTLNKSEDQGFPVIVKSEDEKNMENLQTISKCFVPNIKLEMDEAESKYNIEDEESDKDDKIKGIVPIIKLEKGDDGKVVQDCSDNNEASIREEFHTCVACEETFFEKQSFENHFQSCTGATRPQPTQNKQPYACGKCSFSTDHIHSLSAHISKNHQPIALPKNKQCIKHGCEFCDFSTAQPKRMLTHLRMEHLIYSCKRCSYVGRTTKELGEHFRQAHVIKHYRCSKCKFKTHKRTSLDSHLRTRHFVGEPLKCAHCTYFTRNDRKLKAHLKAEHSDQIVGCRDTDVRCNECDYFTQTKASLILHLRIHKKQRKKQYQCPDCEFSSKSQKYLKQHLKFKHPSNV